MRQTTPLLLLALAACAPVGREADPAPQPPSSTTALAHSEPPPMATPITTDASARPPLDLRAPAHTETATFALG